MGLIERILTNAEWALAGLIGALVAVPFQEELSTWRGRLVFIGSGATCAYFTTPLAISMYNIDPGLSGGVGFLLGAFGGSLLSAGLRTIRGLDLIELVKERFSRTGGGQ
ncbi:hypothetical protein [Aeromonas veronii]|uniref:hypothetical protein n=1 Tax=Aeromonas veronii TaxID=654 RepID=UPI002444C262|nr:hypothetical protein [Aeromonas veronii]